MDEVDVEDDTGWVFPRGAFEVMHTQKHLQIARRGYNLDLGFGDVDTNPDKELAGGNFAFTRRRRWYSMPLP